MTLRKILVVDDDAKTAELIRLYLSRDGNRVTTAADGEEALRLARREQPDLIVLDLMIPGVDGLEVCRTLRQESDVPVVMLTARTTDADKLAGLNSGADDYITKPFSPGELVARVRAVLRRLPGERVPEKLRYGQMTANFRKHEVFLAGRPIELTTVELKLLGALARKPGQVLSRARLIDEALGADFDGYDRTIDVHIHNLRRKLESEPGSPRYIRTVYGAGYKLAGGGR